MHSANAMPREPAARWGEHPNNFHLNPTLGVSFSTSTRRPRITQARWPQDFSGVPTLTRRAGSASSVRRMNLSVRAVAAIGGAAVLLASCSSSHSTTATTTGNRSTNTTSAGSQSSPTGSPSTTDYSNLLIAATDIPVPGFTEATPSTPPNGTGVTASYTSSDNSRVLGDTVLVFPAISAATTAAQASITAAKAGVTSAQVSTAPIGAGGTAIRGTSAEGAVAIVVFTEGRAEVVLQFDSPANDPVPTSVVQQVATKQDGLIKTNLPQ